MADPKLHHQHQTQRRALRAAWTELVAALPAVLLAAAFALAPAPAAAAGELKIAVVTNRDIEPYEEAVKGFRHEILGRFPNADITVFDLRGGKDSAIASELASGSYQLVHAVGTEAYRALAGKMSRVPLVVSMVYDPETEFHLSAARDTRVYGAPLRVPVADQLRMLKVFCPNVRRVSYVYTKGSSIPRAELEAAAPAGVQLLGIPIEDLGQLEDALATARMKSDAFLMLLDPTLYTKATTQNVLLYFMRARLPVISFSPNFAKAGALLSISARYQDNGSTAGRLAIEVLTGTQVLQRFPPTPFLRFDWNRRAAELLGIELSPENRARCTEIYGS